MTSDLIVLTFFRAQFAASVAILLVLAIRAPARRLIGAGLAYRLWTLAPVAALSSLFPALTEFLRTWWTSSDVAIQGVPLPVEVLSHSTGLLKLWAAGAGVVLAVLLLGELRFRRQAAAGLAGPAVMGLSWPRIVLPLDYEHRFTAEERGFIGQHERAHIARRDPHANLFIAAMQVLGWFNPLIHVAAGCARLDQELACDAAVIERRPEIRRAYAATLVKAHIEGPKSVFACAWSAGARHPLEVRLRMMAKPPLSLPHYLAGMGLVGILAVGVALGVWCFGPEGMTQSTATALSFARAIG